MLWCRTYSLYSPQMLAKVEHRGLLLQFLISDLIEAVKAYKKGAPWSQILSTHPCFIPYDWGNHTGYLNKIQEHAILMCSSFPKHKRHINQFEKALEKNIHSLSQHKEILSDTFLKAIREIYLALERFLLVCNENENLILFLLKNKEEIDQIMGKGHLRKFLEKMHPEGLEKLGEKMCDRYHQRGFFSQIPEFKLLLSDLIHV